jgi:Zn-dependent peptidase ImmA (M78 family)
VSMIRDIVEGLMEMYKARNPFELCKCLEIKVIFSDLGDEVKGFFQRTVEGYEIIHINERLSEEEQRYICAHELGHAILHTDISLSFFIENRLQVKNKYEIQADMFAAELLIEDNLTPVEYSGLNIEQICRCLCVPEKLMKYKFNLNV